MKKTTRTIEMYYGFYLGDTKMWDTTDVDIPANTPEDQVERVATAKLTRRFERNPRMIDGDVAFMGVYCTNDDEGEN